MIRPLKSLKNSFIFLETIFALIILGFLVSSFFKLTHDKPLTLPNLFQLENHFHTKSYNEHFSSVNSTLNFTKDDNTTLSINVKKTIYSDGKIRLVKYE